MVVLAALCCAALSGCDPRISISGGLYPGLFQSRVRDYVNRCDPSEPSRVSVDAPEGTLVSVEGSTPRSGQFHVRVRQQVGHRIEIGVTENGRTRRHWIRCLPTDFPEWTASRTGRPQARFYATTMLKDWQATPVVFDTNGVPVWWLPRGASYFLAPLPNGNFGTITGSGLLERRLDGTTVRQLATRGGPADPHDVLLLPNGNYVLATAARASCDLSSWGLAGPRTCIEHVFQELTPDGTVVWRWNAARRIPVTETTRSPWRQWEVAPGVYDPWHYNSVEFTGDGFIISFRHLDAVYKVDRTTGAIDWKLGGTRRRASLTIVGGRGFSGQHDARLLPDGTLSIHDNRTLGTGDAHRPRVVTYRIDERARTATRVNQFRDPQVPDAFCCGSARRLSGGGWVVGWGGNNPATEYAPDGSPVFRLQFGLDFIMYRALPLLPGQFRAAQFRRGMDAQYGAG